MFVGAVGAVVLAVTPVGRRVADVVVGAQELIIRTRRLVAVLLVRVVVTVLEEVATVHLGDALGAVGARHLTILAHQPATAGDALR